MIALGLGAGLLKTPDDFTNEVLGSAATFLTWGAITAGAYRQGNPEPRAVALPDGKSFVNAVNLENPGSDSMIEMLPDLARKVASAGKKLYVNLTPTGPGTLAYMLEQLTSTSSACTLVARLSCNFACPNHKEGDRLSDVMAQDPVAVREELEQLRSFQDNFEMKIAPDTPEEVLKQLCDLCEEFGLRTIVSGNTRKIQVPVIAGKPVLHKSITHCGHSGEPLVEGNLEQVEFISNYAESHDYRFSVRACGGILTGATLKRYEDAGAHEAELVTGQAIHGPRIFSDIYQEYAELV